MSILAKRFLAFGLIAALCLHFLFIVVYSSPVKLNSPKVNFLSSYYTYPFFHQSWSLFVPAPKSENNLFVRYKNSTSWSNWEDLLEKEIMNHRRNRMSGNETVVLMLSNSLHYLINVLPKESTLHLQEFNGNEFEVLQFELNQYLKFKAHLKNDSDYEILVVTKKDNALSANYFKNLKIN